jgi:hypothetical protein
MSQLELLKLTAIIMLPCVLPLGIYFQFVPTPPLVVDLLVFPGSMILYFLILRGIGVFRRFQNPDDEQFQVRDVNAVRSIMCFAALPIFVIAIVGPRHEDILSDSVLTMMLAISAVGLFVSFPFMIAYSVMEFVAWRRKRRARAAGIT